MLSRCNGASWLTVCIIRMSGTRRGQHLQVLPSCVSRSGRLFPELQARHHRRVTLDRIANVAEHFRKSAFES